jgi:hypothetical protein
MRRVRDEVCKGWMFDRTVKNGDGERQKGGHRVL